MAMDGYLSRFTGVPDIQVVAILRFGNELVDAYNSMDIDVLLMDIHVPTSPDNPNPFPIWHIIQELLERKMDLSVIIISMLDRPALIDAAIEAGVSGYILKEDITAYAELPSIVRMIHSGGVYFSPAARERSSSPS